MLRLNYNLVVLLIIAGLSLFALASCGGGGSAALPDPGAGLEADDGAGGGEAGAGAEAEDEAADEAEDETEAEGGSGAEIGEGGLDLLFDGVFLGGIEAALSPPPDVELIHASYDTVAGALTVVGEAHSVGAGSQVFIRDAYENVISAVANENGAFSILPTVMPISPTICVTQIMGSQPESKSISVTVWFY